MSNVIKIPIKPKIALPESFLVAQNVLGIADPGPPVGFRLRRSRKKCVEVWLFFKGGLQLNLTVQNKLELANFYDARGWVHGYLIKHGFDKIKEIKKEKPRTARPVLRLVK